MVGKGEREEHFKKGPIPTRLRGNNSKVQMFLQMVPKRYLRISVKKCLQNFSYKWLLKVPTNSPTNSI